MLNLKKKKKKNMQFVTHAQINHCYQPFKDQIETLNKFDWQKHTNIKVIDNVKEKCLPKEKKIGLTHKKKI